MFTVGSERSGAVWDHAVVTALRGDGSAAGVWEWLTALADRAVASCSIPHHVADDYRQEALIGAVEAPAWDPSFGVPLSAYLMKHMKWGVLRAARRQDPLPESVRRDARAVVQACESLMSLGLPTSDEAVAERAGISLKRLREVRGWSETAVWAAAQQVARNRSVVSWERQFTGVEEAVAALPPREREVILRRYFDGAGVAVVAQELGVSKGRVSQLAGRALNRLRAVLSNRTALNG